MKIGIIFYFISALGCHVNVNIVKTTNLTEKMVTDEYQILAHN